MAHTRLRLFFIFYVLAFQGFSQVRKPVRYRTELGSYVATSGETPFWLRANQYGIVPKEAALMTLRQAVRVDYHDAPQTKLDSLRAVNRQIDWGWGRRQSLTPDIPTSCLFRKPT